MKLDGELIFTAYPYYENVAAGGLLLWPGDHRVTSYGIGVCYVPNENAYESTYEPLEAIKIPTKSSPMVRFIVTCTQPSSLIAISKFITSKYHVHIVHIA